MATQNIPAEVSMKRIIELFDIHWGRLKPISPTHIVLDLNSTFNTICRISDLASYGYEKFLSELNSILREFIQSNLDKKIIILYNKEKTYMAENFGKSYLSFFYDERPKVADTIINLFIGKLEELSSLSNIVTIDCGKFEPSYLIYVLLTYNKDIIVLSRSKPVISLVNQGGYFWDGKFMYHKSLEPRNIHSESDIKMKYKFPVNLPFSLYPYYICMRGIPEHGYTGLPKYGEKRTMEYIQEHVSDIISGNDKIFNYENLEYLFPPEFILHKVLKDEKLKEEFGKLKSKLM